MKALAKYKSHTRGEKGDSLKFIDDALANAERLAEGAKP